MDTHQTLKGEVRRKAATVLLIFFLLGLVLFVVSLALPSPTHQVAASPGPNNIYVTVPEQHSLAKDIARELGIVLLTVCGVSMVYELFVAESHFGKFFDFLYKQFERGESNAAVCERLGVREIFTSRALYEAKYPLAQVAGEAGQETTLRIIARSLFLVMNKPEPLKRALTRGARVELCCFDPEGDFTILREIAFLERSDIEAALSRFNREFIPWLKQSRPEGQLELRYHRIHVFDSYFKYSLEGQPYGALDFSFGRDVTDKRIFVFDLSKGMGADLDTRYEMIWGQAVPVVVYRDGELSGQAQEHAGSRGADGAGHAT
jgi:hypothetical protein